MHVFSKRLKKPVGLLIFKIPEEVQAEHEKFGYIHKIPVSKKVRFKVSTLPD